LFFQEKAELSSLEAGLVSRALCDTMCDHYWCQKEKRCISRNDRLQGEK
jgi:hypothetical protein